MKLSIDQVRKFKKDFIELNGERETKGSTIMSLVETIEALQQENEQLKTSEKICEDCWNHAQAKAEGRLVVLPCKVGNVVYEPRKDRGIISEYEITEIIINKYGVSFFRWNLKEGIYSHLGGFPVECLGKTVFLTREEAEKAIAEVGE